MPRARSPLLLLLALGCQSSAEPRPVDGGWASVQVTFQDGAATVERVTYRTDGLLLVGQVCRPRSAGSHPLIAIAHGGWQGLVGEWSASTSACLALGRAGYVVVEPSYRGEDGSEGSIEICRGESADLRGMLGTARLLAGVDSNRIAILGGSHGGCVTLRSLAEGQRARRVVAVAAPTDLAAVYDSLSARIAAGATDLKRQAYQLIVDALVQYIGGPPASVPTAYRDRNLLAKAASLTAWPGKLLVQQGAEDDIVAPAQSCSLAAAMGSFQAYHVDAAGQVVTSTPAACAGFGLTWLSGPLPADWPAARYLVLYDSLDHGGGINLGRQQSDAFRFLTAP